MEAQVAAWLACHVLADTVLPKEWLPAARVTAVGGQTPREVDDIGAVTEAGGHLLIQSKKSLGLGREQNSPLAKAIRQIVRQYTAGLPGDVADGHRSRLLDQGRDRLIVVTDGGAPETVRVGLARAVDRLAHLPENLPFSDVADNKDVIEARDAVLAHLRREWGMLLGSPPDDCELRGVLKVVRVRALCADDDGRDWDHAIGLLEKVLANPGDARAAWNTLVKYFLEVAAKRQWVHRDRLCDELRHSGFRLRPNPPAPGEISPEDALAELKGEYLARVRQRYGRADLQVLTPLTEEDGQPAILLGEVFVPQSARLNPPPVELPRELWRRLVEMGEIRDGDVPEAVDRPRLERAWQAYRERPLRSVLEVITGTGGQRLVLLGDPGAGKSTLARYLMLALAGDLQSGSLAPLEGYVPLLVELRTYGSPQWRSGTFLDLIDYLHVSENLGFPKSVLEAYLRHGGRALVVFDGLDEIFDPAIREQAARQIEAFANRYQQARVIVTSRPTGYPARPVLEDSGFTRYLLQDLDLDQVTAFTTAWYAASLPEDPTEAARLRDRVLEAITSSAAIAELAGNPMLLTILTIIGRRQELPRERREVYEHAVRVLAEHWDTTGKHLHDENLTRLVPYLSHDDKLELLGRIARRMQEGGDGLAGNRLARKQLEGEFVGYLGERLQLPVERAIPAADAMIRQLQERNFILASYGAGLYGFVHRAFLEYLCARDLHRRFADREMSEAELLAVFQDRWQDPAWEEVLVLLAGMLHERFTAQAIDWLLTADPVWFLHGKGWFLHDVGVPRHVLLAIRCLGEVRKPGAVRTQSLAVARALIGVLDIHRSSLPGSALPVLARLGPDWVGTRLYQAWYRTQGALHAVMPGGPGPIVADIHLALLGLAGQRHEDAAVRARRRRRMTRRLTSRSNPGAGLLHEIQNAAADWRDHPETRTWLLGCVATRDAHGRAEALRALAEDWGSPDTVRLLRRLAESDPAPETRAAAIEALMTVPDGLKGCRAWLRARATLDEDEKVRKAAVTAIAAASPEPDLVDWLHERAIADEHGSVRAAALAGLAGRSGEDPRVDSWLRDRAVHDPAGYVRAGALQAMASTPADGALCDWLRDRAVSDPEEFVRLVSATALAEGWWQAPNMAQWFRERVVADPSGRFRSKILRELARRWPDAQTEALLRDRAITDQDEFVRHAAIDALAEGWWQAPGMAGWLRERSTADNSWVVRSGALRVMAACWPDAESARSLSDRAAADPDEGVRDDALELLAIGWPDGQSHAVLRDRATADQSSRVRRTALKLLAAIWHDAPGTLPWLIERAKNDSAEDVRQEAWRIAGRWDDQQAITPEFLERAVHGEDARARAHALTVLAAGGTGSDIAKLIRDCSVTDPDPDVREAAIEALTSMRPDDPGTIAWICDKAGSDEDPQVCLKAVDTVALNWADDPNATSWLREHARSDKRWYVRAAAARALCREGDLAITRDHAAADRHVWVRIMAIDALGNTQQDHATTTLLRDIAVTDRHPRARGEALEALARQADEDVRAFIRQRVSLDPNPVVRLRAALARAARDHLRWGERDWDTYLRIPSLSIEDSRLDGETRTMLRDRAVTDPDKRVRAAALQVLGKKMRNDDRLRERHHDDDTETLLRERATSDDDPDVRAAAAEALAGDTDTGRNDPDGDAAES